MATKHEILAQICEQLGITADPNWFSKGSTITRDSLDVILQNLGKAGTQYQIETKPIPCELRAIFVKFLRGFEDHYRILTGEDVIVRTDVLPNGGVGIFFEATDSETAGETSTDNFTQWLYFALTGDPSYIASFNDLPSDKQALIMNNLELHKMLIIQQRMISRVQGNTGEAVQTAGLAPLSITFNNYIDTTAHAHAETHSTLLGERIAEALERGDENGLRRALEMAAEREKDNPGFLKKVFQTGMGTAGKIVIKSLKTWLEDPGNVANWPPWLTKTILSALG